MGLVGPELFRVLTFLLAHLGNPISTDLSWPTSGQSLHFLNLLRGNQVQPHLAKAVWGL